MPVSASLLLRVTHRTLAFLDDGSTALIEMTEGFSLDRYGLNAAAYLAVVSVRWRELVGVT